MVLLVLLLKAILDLLPLAGRYDEVSELCVELLQHIVGPLPSVIELLLEVALVVLLNQGLLLADMVIRIGEDLRRMAVDVLDRLAQVVAVGPHEELALVLRNCYIGLS